MTSTITCDGTGAQSVPSQDGPIKFSCPGCDNCATIAPAILTPLGEQYRQVRIRAAKIANVWAATSPDQEF